jgi:hypothetical protein
VDIVSLYKPGTVRDILRGRVWDFEITQQWALGALALMTIPSVMIALSVLLPTKANQLTHIVAASLFILVSVGNAIGETWAFIWLGAIVEVVLVWSLADFVLAGVLLTTIGVALELAMRKAGIVQSRLASPPSASRRPSSGRPITRPASRSWASCSSPTRVLFIRREDLAAQLNSRAGTFEAAASRRCEACIRKAFASARTFLFTCASGLCAQRRVHAPPRCCLRGWLLRAPLPRARDEASLQLSLLGGEA